MKIVDINRFIDGGKAIYNEMTANQYSIDRSWEHCHSAFLKIKHKYANPKTDMTCEDLDFLCLSLGWYLASWGMLRNSFLNKYSHEIHKDAIKLIYDQRWESLWDVDYTELDKDKAERIQNLASELEDKYKRIHQFKQDDYQLTDTLKTKILLGTIACVPAYDRFFVCALRHTLDKTRLCTESILELADVYRKYRTEFAGMKSYCGSGNYPSAKLLDMCFFKYGTELSKIEDVSKEVIKSVIPGFNSRCKSGRMETDLICLYVMHGELIKNIQSLSQIYNGNSATYDLIQQTVILKLANS